MQDANVLAHRAWLKVPAKNVIEDTEYDFFHKTTALTHTTYFFRIRRSGFRRNGIRRIGFQERGL